MADQTFAVHCGFFDAIDSDRTYSADEMNRPYRRVISNGVFATPSGTPSTDLQVVESSGMNIICKAGEGLFADKWFENPSPIVITVPDNTATVPRIDSVLVQVDTRTSGRVGNIVYRTGTPASSPTPPAINQTEGVVEYRLANIRVNAGVTSILGRYITDRRGSSDCPWVTSLIYQVDTSTLYDQWASAYAEYFEQEKAIWDAWYSQLTDDLDVSMTLDRHTNTVTTTAQTTGYIPIGLAYNHNTDILEVYINGLRAVEGTHYVVVDDTTILVENQLQIGQEVTFVVMRSVISGSATTIMVLLQELESQIAGVAGGTPTVVDAKADMTEHDKIYILSTDSKWYYYSTTASDWVAGGTYGGVPTDTTLSISGSAADAKAVGDALALKADDSDVDALDTRVAALESDTSDGLTDEIKQALLDCFAHVVWSDGHGQDYYDALEEALYPPATLTSITAVYTQSGTVYDTSSLNSLKSDLVVTAHYDDSTSETVTDYVLSGTLTEGTSTITVTYKDKTTTFDVTVTAFDWYTVQTSDVGGWNYPTYGGVSYAKTNNLNNLDASKTALKFVEKTYSNRPVLWDAIPASAEYVYYDEGALVAEFSTGGSGTTPSELTFLRLSDSAIAMLRKFNFSYTSFDRVPIDLSGTSHLNTVNINNNGNLTSLPELPSSVTTFNAQNNTSLVDLSGWETPSGITSARQAFSGCTSLEKAPIINAPNCTTFNLMFQNVTTIKEIAIKAIDANYLFSDTTGLISNGLSVSANYCMIKCEPDNSAWSTLRTKFASSNWAYNKITFGLTGRTNGSVKRICMYGDSLTKYNGDTGTYGTMPAQLSGLMANNVAVHNFGYAGSTALSYKSYFDARTELQADVSVVWFGTNNTGMSGADIATQIQTNVIDGLTSDKYIVIGLFQGNYSESRNSAMATAFGNHYLDIHAYTLANWETITGLTPTSEDETAVANGNIPPSLLQSDSIHLNAYSGLVVATAIKEKLLSLGYIDNSWIAV